MRKIADVGRSCEILLNDERVQQAWRAIELDIIEEFRTSPVDKAAEYWGLLHSHRELIHRLEIAIANGREAEREIERMNEDARRDRNAVPTRH